MSIRALDLCCGFAPDVAMGHNLRFHLMGRLLNQRARQTLPSEDEQDMIERRAKFDLQMRKEELELNRIERETEIALEQRQLEVRRQRLLLIRAEREQEMDDAPPATGDADGGMRGAGSIEDEDEEDVAEGGAPQPTPAAAAAEDIPHPPRAFAWPREGLTLEEWLAASGHPPMGPHDMARFEIAVAKAYRKKHGRDPPHKNAQPSKK
jgi:hypothetical protein